MGYNYLQGKFTPVNHKKYKGDVNNIIFRSSWELATFRFCDNTEEILAWNSEETIINYISPLDGRPHRYFTDITAWIKTHDGSIVKNIIEIKPHAQTIKPVKRPTEKDTSFLERVKTYAVNQAKWKYAKEYCKNNSCNFVILTEKHIFPANHSLKPYKQPKK
jgi:hypothetical protein